MLTKLLQVLHVYCSHHNTSKPFAAAIAGDSGTSGDWNKAGADPSHYVVCLDCGKKFTYDWTNMRVVF